jgi:tetratricopeptide (TPR) repeat protein
MMEQQSYIGFEQSGSMLEVGYQYHQTGRYAEAEELFRQFLLANPEHAQAWRLLGLTCEAQNKLADAEANYRQALRFQPGDAEAHNSLGVALAKQGNFVQAAASFEEAIRLQPDHLAAYKNLADVLLQQGQPDKATLCMAQFVRLQPGNADGHHEMGAVLAKQGQIDKAVHSFEQALRIKPDHSAAHSGLDRSRFLLQSQSQNVTNQLLGAIYYNQIMAMDRYADPKRLLRYGYKVYSQGYEDGIIQEIFSRIGITNKRFIEFGSETQENNTLFLLISGWKGLWLDAKALDLRPLAHHVTNGTLKFGQVFITEKNINTAIREHYGTGEIDLLSIDISGNDYWVWKALDVVNPRVVVIEYNSSFSPFSSMTANYVAEDQLKQINRLNDFGASLKAYEKLGADKGYRLVGCELRGVDAFFVREDLVNDLFCEPFTAENHYELPRFFPPQWPPHAFAQGEFKEV